MNVLESLQVHLLGYMNVSIMAKCNSKRTMDVNGRVSNVGYLSGGTLGINVRATVTPANFSYIFVSCLGSE